LHSLPNHNSIEVADFATNSAADALLFIDDMQLACRSSDDILRTGWQAQAAASAIFRINGVDDQSFAYTGRAAFLLDVSFVFITEITGCGQDRVWGRLP
jgi:hypothetical protein